MAANEDEMFTLHKTIGLHLISYQGQGWQVIQNQKYITSVKII